MDSEKALREQLIDAVDKQDEMRYKRGRYFGRVLDRLDAKTSFGSEDNRREFLKKMSYPDFKRYLLYINDTLRSMPRSEKFDGADVVVRNVNARMGVSKAEDIPPAEEDKDELLGEALRVAKELPDLKDAGLLIGTVIAATHPFADANGRESRVIYSLIADGYDGTFEQQTELVDLAGPNGGSYLDMNPSYAYQTINFITERGLGIKHKDPHSVTESWSDGAFQNAMTADSLPVAAEIDRRTRQILLDIVNVKMLRTAVFYSFLQERDMLREPFTKYKESEGRLTHAGRPDKWTTIQIDEVLKILTPETARELIATDRNLRKVGIQMLIKAFEEPERFPVQGGSTLKGYLKAKILDSYLPRSTETPRT